MSTIEQRLYESLTTSTDITDLTQFRIYPVAIPESTDYPCIGYQVISGTPVSTMNHDEPTLRYKRIQINVWGEKYGEVKELETYIENAIYNGTVKGHIENYRDLEDRELKLFGVSLDFISHNK